MTTLVKPRILPGFMELLPEKQIMMNRLMDTIRQNFETFGFAPLDTPVIELSEVLLAKAGGETEKQIYRFNKGDTDLSLRFDLTVPLARYVAEHQQDLTFPFKRYQIGKVYRGEHPQKGRFREFYQCDIDIIGRDKLGIMYDAEVPSIIYNIFTQLGLTAFKISINNRKILKGFFEYLELSEQATDILRSVDKLAKIGVDGVKAELNRFDIPTDKIDQILSFVMLTGDTNSILESLQQLPVKDDDFLLGVQELQQVLHGMKQLGIPEQNYRIDLSIARGLDYYTGTIYETTLDDYPEIGSICSGGRYENLASFYTNEKLPGVGISIGLTRLFDQFQNRGFISESTRKKPITLLILPMDENLDLACRLATRLREKHIPTEIFMETTKFGKKMTYANRIGAPLVAIIGEDEIKNETVTLKNMQTGEQTTRSLDDTIAEAIRFHEEISTTESKPIQIR